MWLCRALKLRQYPWYSWYSDDIAVELSLQRDVDKVKPIPDNFLSTGLC